jgi:hypothetical protein
MDNTRTEDQSDERGKTADTIKMLAEGLIHETDSREHRFRASWVDLLLERYTQRPGSPIMHLSDFTDHARVHLRPEARAQVDPYWHQLVALDGRRAWKHFRSVVNYLKDEPVLPRIKQWKDFGRLTGFDMNSLEPHVDSIRLSDGPHIRMLNNPKLPVNLATPAGARLIGYYFDSNSRNGAFTNKDSALHEDFRKTVREVFGDLTISETLLKRGGFCEGAYIRTNVGCAVRSALSVAGFDCTRDQTQANNPLPSWMFNQSSLVKSECLSAVWDTEGSVNYHDVKMRQAAPFIPCGNEILPTWPKTIAFRRTCFHNQSHVFHSPPLVVVSAALLLYSMGVVSRLVPTGLTLSHGDPTAYWQLRVEREASIQEFHSRIKLRSAEKQSKLDALCHKSSSPSPFSQG